MLECNIPILAEVISGTTALYYNITVSKIIKYLIHRVRAKVVLSTKVTLSVVPGQLIVMPTR